jgi:hypothetical protein
MRLPRVRFTVRRMMIVVSLAALALVACRFLSEVWAAIDDTRYMSFREFEKSWDVGPSPKVVVDIFTGRINVVQASDDKVTAKVSLHALRKMSQDAADRACASIRLAMSCEEGTVRITALVPPEFSVFVTGADVLLYVPRGVRLDLYTRHGDIKVGQAVVGASLVRSPPAVRSIKARADFNARDWTYQGDIFVETSRMAVEEPTSPETDLQLDGVRQVEIHAEDATVQARARGGTFVVEYETTAEKMYAEHKVEGSITFEGSLFERPHSFWAADRVKVCVPAEATFGLDAEASKGSVTSAFPVNVGGIIERSKIRGIIGATSRTSVRARVDAGSIEIEAKR